MGYSEYLKSVLRPLQLYDLENGAGAAELDAAGTKLDEVFTSLADSENDAFLQTASPEKLNEMATLLPFLPLSVSAADLRRALLALYSLSVGALSLERLNSVISGCGIPALVTESETPETVEVSLPGVAGEPDNFNELKLRIEQILPAHLDIVYNTGA